MTTVTIKLAPSCLMREFYFGNTMQVAAKNISQYIDAGNYKTDQTGSDAAEEMFDLTNNPSRSSERLQKYGRNRSLSTGDIVTVDGVDFVCMSIGWKELESQ